MSGILQLADALDRGHDQNTTELTAELIGDNELLVRATTREAPDLERWSSIRRKKLLEDSLGVTTRVEVSRREDNT